MGEFAVEVKLIPVAEWAASMRGGRAPSRGTIRNWMLADRIQPKPVKVGGGYFVDPAARYVDPREELLERIRNGR